MSKDNLIIEVTQDHINRAIARKNKKGTKFQVNPIGIAINDKTHRNVFVDGHYIEYQTSCNNWRSFTAPRSACKFMERFNSNKNVKPFSLTLKPSMEIKFQ
jgi:hypothetical protein